MSARIELPEWITGTTLEQAWKRCKDEAERNNLGFAEKGMRVARAREPKMMLALEKGAEVFHHLVEVQYGRTMRDPATPFGFRVQPTEATLWQQAYEFADKGEPLTQFAWVYGAAAELAGF